VVIKHESWLTRFGEYSSQQVKERDMLEYQGGSRTRKRDRLEIKEDPNKERDRLDDSRKIPLIDSQRS